MHGWALCRCGKPLEYLEKATPSPTGAQVLLAVEFCGVCHSDIHLWEGYYDLGGGRKITLADRGIELPMMLGHEIVGRVVALGPEAEGQGVTAGDRRIVYPWIGCGICRACRSEQDNLCPAMRSLGIFQDGGYGSHVLCPHPRYLVDPGPVAPAYAATLACSGLTAYAAASKLLPLEPAEPVVVIGAGGVGLSAVSVLKAFGRRVIVVDVAEDKLLAATAAGASMALDGASPMLRREIHSACAGPPQAVIDFVNSSQSAGVAFDVLGKGGKLVQVGLFGGDLNIALPAMTSRALTLQGSFVGSPQELRDVVGLAAQNRLPPLPIEIVPQADPFEALMRLRRGEVVGRLVLQAT